MIPDARPWVSRWRGPAAAPPEPPSVVWRVAEYGEAYGHGLPRVPRRRAPRSLHARLARAWRVFRGRS